MSNIRAHGRGPFRVAVVHGGPGGAGEMAEIATQLADERGILEPLQTEGSVDGQVDELASALRVHASPPVTLIAHSWGAWLSIIVGARYPELAGKLVLVSCGALEARFVADMHRRRLERLTEDERSDFQSAVAALEEGSGADAGPGRDEAFGRLARLAEKADSFDLLPGIQRGPQEPAAAQNQAQIYASVWPEAAEMRRRGELLALAGRLSCPVLAIHGDSDPSPAAGVREPLAKVVPDFRFELLARCGHTPWRERQAREAFFGLLRAEISGLEDGL